MSLGPSEERLIKLCLGTPYVAPVPLSSAGRSIDSQKELVTPPRSEDMPVPLDVLLRTLPQKVAALHHHSLPPQFGSAFLVPLKKTKLDFLLSLGTAGFSLSLVKMLRLR